MKQNCETYDGDVPENLANMAKVTGEFSMKRAFLLGTVAAFVWLGQLSHAQTANTGALVGTVTDASGAVVPGAQILVTNNATGQSTTILANGHGYYNVPLLPPGSYSVDASKSGFSAKDFDHVTIQVTETATLNIALAVGTVSQKVTVNSNAAQLDTTDAQLGNVIDSRFISTLPLSSRNYLQIIGLNPGISAELTDAGALGSGNGSLATGGSGFSSNGAATQDNNFQMNGVPVNDNSSEGIFTGGIPIPNPDTLQEFNVVTGPYDASYGRNGGANVDVVTKTGSNDFHATLFEFFRNNDMNANTWFLNNANQPRAVLKQNQFGGTVGGHLVRNKLFYFGSYQGTRQRNGLDPSCSATTFMPPLTNDRSAAALGALFAGQRGYIQDLLGGVGPAILPDGSNINPVALNLLQRKLSDGTYMIPTPQTINTASPTFDTQGRSVFSVACPYTEDQYMANGDYVINNKSQIQLRYFMANTQATRTLPSPRPAGSAVPGFPFLNPVDFKNASITHTYTFTPQLINQLELGYNRSSSLNTQGEQFSWSDIGATVPAFVNDIPGIGIDGVGLGGDAENTIEVQNTFFGQDSLAWTRGRHNLRVGGDYTYGQVYSPYLQDLGGAYFLTFADLLLGLNANQNGTAAAGLPYSNEYLDEAVPGDLSRYYWYYDASGYAQDDIKVTPRFTFNVGLRFEHLGDFSAKGGRNTDVDLTALNPNPPAAGTLQGYTVPSNYPLTLPPGVIKLGNTLGIKGKNQNMFEPRIGFAWQPSWLQNVVVRGGYGVYGGLYGTNGLAQSIASPPFTAVLVAEGSANAPATLQNPIWQPVPALPSWDAAVYSPTTAQSFDGLDQNARPPFSQHYSMDVQTQFASNFLFDVAFAGARNTHLIETNYVNQAYLASPSNPIRGQTTNTVANIPLRVPYEGWATNQFALIKSDGSSWYNSLQASLTKRFSHGLQFIAAYTWARDLTNVSGAVTGGGFGGSIYGDQRNLRASYGPDPFVRPQRFIFSYVWDIPTPGNPSSLVGRLVGHWYLAGVTTVQSGHPLFAVWSNANNAYGVPNDRPDYLPGCAVNKSGSIEKRINDYFNTNCFTSAPVIGADGVATAFGNAPIGNIKGPGQFVSDVSLGKNFPSAWPKKDAQLNFKADFFNVFNHPVFSDPTTDFSPNAGAPPGVITATVSNPRIIQLSLKYLF
jgi:Carboxypeptidase regulatory-like domain/TonB-dependent Receptor Plug Domain